MNNAIRKMTEAIHTVMDGHVHSVWLYGSVVLDDFRPGWSDIDILVLTNGRIDGSQTEQLLTLRQTMLENEPVNPFYRSFEGMIADISEYRKKEFSRYVYWGTSGQKLKTQYDRDVFSEISLAAYGRCVSGSDERGMFSIPDKSDLLSAVRRHYETIRRYARNTDGSLYSCGWLLDMARCIYTLRYHDIIAKTQAGIWALDSHIFPNEDVLRKTLLIRQNPTVYKDRSDIKKWLSELGPIVQQYADILEKEIIRFSSLP